ncbi:GPO family capsid scaffolding protein [Vibrio sp. HN007]|uniref:GPO family capsid scaffolding protein n=1 Tax=Vibrio iocasae TaxID=3098914 RepID=UPI0035D3E74D
MSKTSDWKIVATEGSTVDGRKITASWIKDMAELYSLDEYPALIWPEHSRSRWDVYQGKNWGEVIALKAEKKDGKLRLFAKLTPNKYLLNANADSQKLFTSIEPDPDYKGEGRCYLTGLAVTDSPASTGTTRLKFSRNDQSTELECSALEELNLDDCFTRSDRFFAMCTKFFTSDEQPEVSTEPEDTDVTKEELTAALKEQFSVMKGELKTELNEEFSNKFAQKQSPVEPEPEVKTEGVTAEQFSVELAKALQPVTEKLNGLETKFNKLADEVPNQEPEGEGTDNKFSAKEMF